MGRVRSFLLRLGYQGDTIYIWLDHERVRVTKNLLDAFHRLHLLKHSHTREATPHWLWVDALCINQADLVERNHQVGRMKYNFGSATVVFCFPVISYIKEWSACEGEQSRSIAESVHRLATIGREASVPSPQDHEVDDFLQNPYWRRIWIIQEMVLAARILCILGEGHLLTWDDLVQAASECTSMILGPETKQLESMAIRERYTIGYIEWLRNNPGIFGRALYVQIAQKTMATDLRDKVYGLSSLYGPPDVSIVPDYSTNLRTVWTDFTVSHIDNNRLRRHQTYLQILPERSCRSILTGLPSWVPSLSFRGTGRLAWPGGSELDPNACIEPTTTSVRTLAVSGFVFDETTSLTSCHSGGSRYHVSDWSLFTQPETSTGIVESTTSGRHRIEPAHRSTFEDLLAVFDSGALTPWMYDDTWAPPGIDGDRKWSALKSDYLGHFLYSNQSFILPNGQSIVNAYSKSDLSRSARDRIMNIIIHRRMTVTAHGRLGIVPADARKGDVICKLDGQPDLGLLRPQGDQWQWIGHCAVTGFEPDECLGGREDQLREFLLV